MSGNELILSLSQTLLEELQAQLTPPSDAAQGTKDSRERRDEAAMALISPAVNNLSYCSIQSLA